MLIGLNYDVKQSTDLKQNNDYRAANDVIDGLWQWWRFVASDTGAGHNCARPGANA